MKICSDCKIRKQDSEFCVRGNHRRGQLQSTCRLCSLERLRKHRKKMRKFLNEYKMAKGCQTCGYNKHPFALHLDHRDPTTKRNRGKAGRSLEVSWSKLRIEEELKKCRVLCANCHAIKTYNKKDHLG